MQYYLYRYNQIPICERKDLNMIILMIKMILWKKSFLESFSHQILQHQSETTLHSF